MNVPGLGVGHGEDLSGVLPKQPRVVDRYGGQRAGDGAAVDGPVARHTGLPVRQTLVTNPYLQTTVTVLSLDTS